MIEKFNKLDDSKKKTIIIISIIGLILLIVLLTVLKNGTDKYKNIKEDNKRDFVYTVESKEEDKYFSYVPYVNIRGSKSINDDINSYVSDFTNKEMIRLSYNYEINGKVLSLVIKTVDYGSDDIPLVYFKTYNINLETRELISDEELLENYNFNYDDVSNSIEKQFEFWYTDLLNEEYFDEEECDYDCFLENRDVENYADDVCFYIEKGNLIVYKPFVMYSIIGEESYFKEEDFKFVISK